MSNHTDRWLLIPEASEYMGMHPTTLRELLLRGEIKGTKVGQKWRTKISWCDEYLMQGAN